ncbi:hypothetical protein F0562_004433 [Nyssa sinensis]|uniref:UBC core domain-containing protein n=1 Tax=Nyssa sinensis TaxID=561372 RepID=A0A5J5BZC1_9ASTE|nr:hypothetical protein F0562_004433 [Nyssa sinensis]
MALWWLLWETICLFLLFFSKCGAELITALPGQPTNISFKQYSGYIVTDARHGRALFYYFVEAESADPLSRPLTLWLNGGPGCSSLGFGAFMEHGPFQVGVNELLVKNEYAWNLAEENLVFIINWLEEFPNYKDSDFFLVGESYAGHYIPQLATLLLEHNKKPNVTPIKLKSIALGNPLLDLDISVLAGDYLWSHGAISDETLMLEKTVCNDSKYLREYVHDQWSQGCNDVFNRVAEEISDDVERDDLLLPNCLSSSANQQFKPKGMHGKIHATVHQFGLALVRLENVVRGTIGGAIRHKLIPTPQNLVTSTPLTTTYESFFGLHPLSQVLDRTNPLTQIVHGRKLSYLGPGGLTGRTASFRIRDIHPSHYGRICPIDTSEGINVGLIGSLAIHARIGHWESLESPFYEISERSKKVRMLYLSSGRDEYYMVAAGNSLALNRGIQEEQVVPARYRQEFLTIAWEQAVRMSTPARKRLMRDFKRLQHDPPAGISGAPYDNNIMLWNAVIFGPDDSPWDGGTFKLTLQFMEEYPNKPPIVRFISRMFHPNIYADGSICLDILQNQWSPIYDVAAILTSIQSLLCDPNPNSPANSEAARLFSENKREYNRRVHTVYIHRVRGERERERERERARDGENDEGVHIHYYITLTQWA